MFLSCCFSIWLLVVCRRQTISETVFLDISFISDKLSIDEFHKGFVFKRFTVTHISGSNHEVQKLSTLVAYQMQLKSEEPAHGTYSSLCYFLERFMNMDSLVLAYPQGGTVNEADTCAFAPKHLLDEQNQWDSHLFFLFDKTVIRNNFWEEMTHILADLFQIEMLQTTVSRIIKKYQDEHDFCLGHGGVMVIFTLCSRFKRIFCQHSIKKFAEIICHTK